MMHVFSCQNFYVSLALLLDLAYVFEKVTLRPSLGTKPWDWPSSPHLPDRLRPPPSPSFPFNG